MDQGWWTIFHATECSLNHSFIAKLWTWAQTRVNQAKGQGRHVLGGLMFRLKLFGWMMIHWHHLAVESSIISSFQQLWHLLMKAETDARAWSPRNAHHQNLGSISFCLFCPIRQCLPLPLHRSTSLVESQWLSSNNYRLLQHTTFIFMARGRGADLS